ncbi:MAG: hypothetical protein HC927_06850 [Deltaproteobacteria bacterium]|nr:hypothetical protein [Deltaproteobacteria bacterium]
MFSVVPGDGLQTEGLSRALEANPHVVQVLAGGRSDSAYSVSTGRRMASLLTFELHRLLRESSPDELGTWRDVQQRLEASDQRLQQHVTMTGPTRRLLFQVDELDHVPENFPILTTEDGWNLMGGRLSGIGQGDVHELLTIGRTGRIRTLGQAEIATLTTSTAELALPPAAPSSFTHLWSRPLRFAEPRGAVALHGFEADGCARELLLARIGVTGFVTAEGSTGLPIVARIDRNINGIQLQIDGLERQDLAFDLERDPHGALDVAEYVGDACTRAARRASFLALQEWPETLPADGDVSWTLGAAPSPLAARGETLGTGSRAIVRFGGASQPRFITAFIVLADGAISLLDRRADVGVPAGAHILLGGPRGVELVAPPTSPKPSIGRLVVFIGDQPLKLRCWEQPGIGLYRAAYRSPTPPLRSQWLEPAPHPPLRPAYAQHRMTMFEFTLTG